MAKKNNAIYAPGELSKVREKLGVTDESEAKRMMQLLGGEVGFERAEEAQAAKNTRSGKRGSPIETADGKRQGRRIDLAGDDENRSRSKTKHTGPYPGDDPSTPVKLSYAERIKMDQYAGQMLFEIKSSMQVVTSIFSFFKEPVDYVNPRFVTKRMNEYYNKIEKLVNATRNLFPKTSKRRNNHLKRASPFVYKIIETIRSWNIEDLAKSIAELQAHPRAIKVSDFSEVLKYIYKPLFVLDDLSIENVKSAFKLVYKILYIESPIEAKDKYQVVIRNIIASLMDIRRNVHFGMYPFLMKLISDRFIPYERFFIERRRRFLALMDIAETEQLNAADLSPNQIESIDVEALQQELGSEDDTEEQPDEVSEEEGQAKEDPNDPKTIERKAKEEADRIEQKALEQGRNALEAIFPQAGWRSLHEFPDLYPYFANVYSMRHGYELIAPTDPLQQVSVLMNILDDLFIGLRYISFGVVTGPDGNSVRVGDELGETLNNWRRYIEDSFSKDYLPRLSEYCRILENSNESRSSAYAKKILNELHWIKRLYFLPYYKFESIGPPPFTKKDIIPIYSLIRKIRKILTGVAIGIEQGIRAGGASAKASCNGINNPWENYNFQVPNPASKRLDLLLPPERRINASIIFFTLSAVTLLDHIINNESSWAYGGRPGPLFRSQKGEGIIPVFGVDEKLDADQIFKETLKKARQQG
ncbi:MAG: hypothetical protein LBU88_06220 [Treponema sp.]|jgi:hypothetical protein|nr:hypothetical protein [Treponema sp.]